jgi:hypothetical protein
VREHRVRQKSKDVPHNIPQNSQPVAINGVRKALETLEDAEIIKLTVSGNTAQQNSRIVGINNIKKALDGLEIDGATHLKPGDIDLLFRLIPDQSDANVSVRCF